jgi:CheY-like chemotaxis protein
LCCERIAWLPQPGAPQLPSETGKEVANVVGSSPKLSPCRTDQSGHFAEPEKPPGRDQRKPGILVVDDEAAVRLLLHAGLRHYGFAVWQAVNGQEAIEMYRQESSAIDLLLLDVRMPVLDGPHTLAALLRLNPHLRCCFMTGQAGIYSEEQLLALGAVRVFQKPFSLAEMVEALAQLIESRPKGPECKQSGL